MKRFLAVARVLACVSMICAFVVVAVVTIQPRKAGAAEHTVKIFNTYFGWWTNTPPGCGGATCTTNPGTYTRPIASAADESEPGFAKGSLFYYPADQKYFEVKGSCQECSTTYKNTDFARMDLYMGGGSAANAGTAFSLIDCEDALTLTLTGVPEQTTWIATPPPGLPVSPLPLYTTKSGRCRTGAVSPPTFDRYVSTTDHKCLQNPTYSATAGTAAGLATCTAVTPKSVDIEFSGAWFYNNGLCLTLGLKWTKCTEYKTTELWEQTSHHTISWIETTQCLGVKPGTVLFVTHSSSCVPTSEGKKKQFQWTKVTEPSIGLASPPSDLTVTPGNASAVVAWSASATPGAFPIKRYTVTASPGGEFCTWTSGPTSCTVATLRPGTAYTFTVRPWSIGGTGTVSAGSKVTLAPYPSAPARPTAIPGNGSITVTWSPAATNGTPISGYTVTVSPGGQTCSPVSLSTLNCTFGTLTNGTAYTFTVTARNATGTSLPSAASTAVAPGTPTAPGKPTAVRGSKSALVSWSASATTNGTPVTAYTVTSSPGTKTCAPTSLSTLSCTVGTLKNGSTYTFTVKAHNGVGTSPASAPSTVVIPAALPAAPAKATVTPGNASLTVSWSAPTSGGTPITAYTVTANPGTETCAPTSLTVLTCVLKTLANGTPYTVTVKAHNGVGTSPASAPSTAVVAGVPTAPGKPTAVSGNKSETVSWTAPTTTNGSPITSYTVTASSGGKTCTWASGPLTCTVGTLTNGTTYTFTVKATNANGTSPASSASTGVKAGTPAAPAKPAAADAGTGSVRVSWSSAATNGAAITKYTATSSGSSRSAKTCSVTATLTKPTKLTCVVTGLTDGSTYTFTVKATNANGTSPASPASTKVVVGTPAAPAAPVATRGNASVSVTWTAPATNGHAISSYTVTSSPGSQTCTWSTGPLTCTVRTLANGTPYTFSVKAKNAEGTSPASPSSVAVVPAGPPTAPVTATATRGNESASVAWTASTPNGTAVSSYTVTAAPGGQSCSPVSLSALHCTVDDLTNGTQYSFTVVAHNGAGTSAASTPSNTVIPAGVPTAPGTPSATAGNENATVSWSASTPDGTAVSSYTVIASPGGETCSPASLTTLQCTVGTLADGTPYTFSVVATNGVGTSTPSATSAPVTPVGPPSAPPKPNAVRGNGSATVSWSAPATNGSTITGYVVTSTTGHHTCTTTSSSALTCTVGTLTDGTSYRFTVTAHNALGTSPPSPASSAVTPAGAPSAPTAPTVARGNELVTVSWFPAATNGSTITSYVVTSNTGHHTCTTTAAVLTCKVKKLINGTPYTFTVTAHNAFGASAPSAASASVTPASVPGSPAKPSVSAGNREVIVTWTPPTTNGSAITRYRVRSTTGLHGCLWTTTSGTALTCTVKRLTNGTSYSFVVRARNAAGVSAYSPASTAVTPKA